MKEILLQYCWRHRIGVSRTLTTTDGESVEVLDPGLYNTDAGPDFINARLRIGDVLWAGNIEIHCRRRDWYAHGHDRDAAYDNVILHVLGTDEDGRRTKAHHRGNAPDTARPTTPGNKAGENTPDGHAEPLTDKPLPRPDNRVVTHSGGRVPEVVISVPKHVEENYEALMSADKYPPCYATVPRMPAVVLHAWMASLQTERLQQKTDAISERVKVLNGDWEHAYFMTLARSFGFGSNSEELESWAHSMPLNAIAHHRDSIFQTEAMFFGMAGLLNIAAIPERMQIETAADSYWQLLEAEWSYLSHKFGIDTATCRQPWRFMRMRPQNFPHIRIAQLAMLYHSGQTRLSELIACDTTEKLRCLFTCGVSEYWQEHYTFGNASRASAKRLSAASVTLLMINCAIPMLFAYGRATGNEKLCDRAIIMLDSLKAEDNTITRMWRDVGLDVTSAGDSQALIQLKKEYCDRRRCTSCRIGYCNITAEGIR